MAIVLAALFAACFLGMVPVIEYGVRRDGITTRTFYVWLVFALLLLLCGTSALTTAVLTSSAH